MQFELEVAAEQGDPGDSRSRDETHPSRASRADTVTRSNLYLHAISGQIRACDAAEATSLWSGVRASPSVGAQSEQLGGRQRLRLASCNVGHFARRRERDGCY